MPVPKVELRSLAARALRGPGGGAIGLALAALAVLAVPPVALGHGFAPPPASLADALLAWRFEAHELLPLLAAGVLFWLAERRVRRDHPANPHPRWRTWCWYGGLAVLLVALQSPIGTYDTTLFSVHMVQHMLISMVAAPLLALAAPITLLLRVSSGEVRRRAILPLLHSWPLRLLTFPVVAWVLFAGVLWATHFSALYDAALEDPLAHLFEHALYLGTALLFWWPAVGADPSPWRMAHPLRIGYLLIGMPQSAFLGLAILSAPQVIYPHYATLVRTWGPTPLEDQQLAGAIMWVGGDMIFLLALILAVWVWLRAEEEEGRRADARLDREAAQALAAGQALSAGQAAPAAPAAGLEREAARR
ncbi:MAG TPA: cytochrome c oxidase assembly protein [Candidatus Limnocylindrales bacterium]